MTRMTVRNTRAFVIAAIAILAAATVASSQTTSFVYQGRLTDGGTSANGNYDLQFALWDSLSGGTQVGSTQTVNTVAVSNGVFTVSLDFGANAFPGASRFLEIGARPSGAGSFTLLTPRQQITSTPYAVRSLNAASADSVPASGVPAGSGNYIQNASSAQTTSNFNISGNGTAGGTLSGNVVNATTQYKLKGSRILSNDTDSGSLFVGTGAGSATNQNGQRNTLVGINAGMTQTTTSDNTFVGFDAGKVSTGDSNAFFGTSAGASNTIGFSNAIFGTVAGISNTQGFFNSFFGTGSGDANQIGSNNSFFGGHAGANNTIGGFNSYFGRATGLRATGSFNTFVGGLADFDNNSPGGDRNTLLGASTTIGTTPTFSPINATAIGANARVDSSNSLVLGSINGINGASADTNVGIGTTAPAARLHVVGNTGLIGSVGIGTTTPAAQLHVNIGGGHILFTRAGCNAPLAGIMFASTVTGPCTNYNLLGGDGNTYINRPDGGAIFFREGNFTQVTITPTGTVALEVLGAAGSSHLCLNSIKEIAFCSSSRRYKTEVKPFGGGLQLVNSLQPVSFLWKANRQPDIGLIAEDVAEVEPLLTFKNQNGEIEGVNYWQVSAVLINAIKEQQAQIQQQRELIEGQQALAVRQQQQLNALKQIVSRLHRRVRVRR